MRVRSFVLAASLGLVPFQSQAVADGTIAIARTSDDRGFSLGVSYNASSRAEADSIALDECQRREAVHPAHLRAPCRIVATFDNQCVAVARDTGEGGTAWGYAYYDLQADADDRALYECRSRAGNRAGYCELTVRRCDGGK